jgi:mitochondrial inner membrane protease subunit 1
MLSRIGTFSFKLAQAAGIVHVTTQYVFDLSATEGASMEPTIPGHGTVLLVDKLSWRLPNRGYQVNDVVVSKSMTGSHFVCKRVKGVAGDIVFADAKERRPIVVPAGHVWLLGDNAKDSVDSREYGAVPVAMLQGKVKTLLFPEFKIIR